jgi:hypothetical protein
MIATHINDSASRVRVRRFRADYLLDANHLAPHRVKAALDESITRSLACTLRTALSAAFPGSERGLWFIRQLEIDVDVNAAWDADVLVARITERIVRELVETIRYGADGLNVISFVDESEYLSRFLADRAAGRGESWHYETFAGLRHLPVSAALRTAILDKPEIGLGALLRLGPDDLRCVLAVLTVQDARWIVEVFSRGSYACNIADCLARAWTAQERLPGSALDGVEAAAVLRLYLASYQENHAFGTPLHDAAYAIVRLVRLVRSRDSQFGSRLVAALTGGNLDALYQACGISDAECLGALRKGHPGWLEGVVAALAPHGPDTAEACTPDSPLQTSFGGTFFLLPRLDELPLEEAAAGWPDSSPTPAAALVRFLILLKCLGSAHAEAAFRDPLLRDLFLLGPDVSPESLTKWQSKLYRHHRCQFLERLDQWYVERGDIRLDTQLLFLGTTAAGTVALLIDSARGHWRWIEPVRGRPPKKLAQRFHHLLKGAPQGGRLFCDRTFVPLLQDMLGTLCVMELPGDASSAGAEEDAEVREIVTRFVHLPDDLEYLSLPRTLGIGGTLDRALSVVAQGVLRSFAWRLPGFARAHLPYLQANFLNVPARLEELPDRRVVVLGRPPLDLVLNLTGANRSTFQLRWLDGKPFVLFPEP